MQDVRPIYIRVGKRIRRRRDELGKTQEWLSERVGMSRPSIANIEAGRQQIMLHQLYDFARALRMPAEDLA